MRYNALHSSGFVVLQYFLNLVTSGSRFSLITTIFSSHFSPLSVLCSSFVRFCCFGGLALFISLKKTAEGGRKFSFNVFRSV